MNRSNQDEYQREWRRLQIDWRSEEKEVKNPKGLELIFCFIVNIFKKLLILIKKKIINKIKQIILVIKNKKIEKCHKN